MQNLVEQIEAPKIISHQNQKYNTEHTDSFDPIPIRINADNSSPRDVLCFWLIFAFFIALSIVLAIFVAPKQIIVKTNKTELKSSVNQQCMNPSNFENNTLLCDPFSQTNPYLGLVIRDVDYLNQFALIYLDVGAQHQNVSHQISQNVSVTLYSMELVPYGNTSRKMFKKKQELGNRTIQFNDLYQNMSFAFYGQKVQHLIGFYRQLKEKNYFLVIKFQDSQQIIKNDMKPFLKAILINRQFTLFIIIIRGVGFIVTLITGLLYFRFYFWKPKQQRIVQQKLVFVMSILIIFFNDPTYIISVINPSTFSSVLSALFLSQFIAFLFFFWIFISQRIYKEQGQMRSNLTTRPKKLIYFLYFLCYFVMLSWFYSGIAVASYQGHFIVNPQEISPGLSFVFQIWLIVNITTYMYIVITILQQGRAKLWRSKVWIYFNIYFAILLLVFVIVSGSVYEQSSKLMLMFYVSLNMYCIYMQYMFTATNTPKQNQKYIPIELNQQQNDSNVIEINTFSKRKQKSISSDL